MSKVLSYEEKDTWIHRLSGVTKLVFFLLWSITSMLSYDTRVLLVMLVCSLIIFKMSRTEWRQVGTVFKFIMFFLVINLLAIFIFSPDQGTKIYGTHTELVKIAGPYVITTEQLFYEFNVMVKYLTVIPAVFMFIVTTNPSEFAASMNRVGISYNICYSVALALRYIPDVQDEYRKIKHAQEARGIEMSSKASLIDRIKKSSTILFPLIFSSMDRIDVVSNAMELRGFGKNKKRTWYMGKKLVESAGGKNSLMFGGTGALIGGFDPFIQGDYSHLGLDIPLWVYIVFQTVFCATAATIVSGSMAERTNFKAYCVYSAAISLVVYPICGHWMWGGGWLQSMGFHDFAGSAAGGHPPWRSYRRIPRSAPPGYRPRSR